LFGQGVRQVVGQGCAGQGVTTGRVCETAALLGTGREARHPLRAPLTTATAGRPLGQDAAAAVPQEGRWGCLRLPAAERGWWRQSLHQRREGRQRPGKGRSPLMAQVAPPFLPDQGARPHAAGSPERRIACHGPQALARAEQVAETVRRCFVGVTGAIRQRFARRADRWTRHQTDPVPTACEPFVARVPGAPSGGHGAQRPSTVGGDEVIPEGLRKELEALPGMGQGQFAAADASLGTQRGTVLGCAPIDSNEEQVRRLHVRFTLLGLSSILLQSQGPPLLMREKLR
jgi:hypothetical protein